MPHSSQLLWLLLCQDELTRPHLVPRGLFWAQNSPRILQKDYPFPWNPTRKQNHCPFQICGQASLEKTHLLRLTNTLHAFLFEGWSLVSPPVSHFEVSSGLHLATSPRSLMAQKAPHILGCPSSPSLTTCPREALPPPPFIYTSRKQLWHGHSDARVKCDRQPESIQNPTHLAGLGVGQLWGWVHKPTHASFFFLFSFLLNIKLFLRK